MMNILPFDWIGGFDIRCISCRLVDLPLVNQKEIGDQTKIGASRTLGNLTFKGKHREMGDLQLYMEYVAFQSYI